MSFTCYILRHGETSNLHDFSSLSEKGRKDTSKLNRILFGKKISRIYSSPQPRAIESVAELTNNGCPLTIDERLRDFVVATKKIDNYRYLITKSFLSRDWSFDSGETIEDVEARLFAFLKKTKNNHQDKESILISTHGVCAALLLSSYSHNTALDIWEKLKVPDLYRIDFEQRSIESIRPEL